MHECFFEGVVCQFIQFEYFRDKKLQSEILTLGRIRYPFLQIRNENCTIADTKSISYSFYEYFATIGSNLADCMNIPLVVYCHRDFLSVTQCNSFHLSLSTLKEIICETQNLNPNKITGPDSIPTL